MPDSKRVLAALLGKTLCFHSDLFNAQAAAPNWGNAAIRKRLDQCTVATPRDEFAKAAVYQGSDVAVEALSFGVQAGAWQWT